VSEEAEDLEARYLAAVQAHRTHPPRLRRGRDGIYRCAACDPGSRWRRAADWLVLTRAGRVCWWAVLCGAVFGLTVFFEHLGWYA